MKDATTEDLNALRNGSPVALSLSDLAGWQLDSGSSRLLLPAIQRSAVWSNEQIINFWDSLLRGYPIGSLLVYRVGNQRGRSHVQATDASGSFAEGGHDDYHLFDGQQRMAALLLGLGQGQFSCSRRLWVDLGVAQESVGELRFVLRISSEGQPFGYRVDAPNQKLELNKRRAAMKTWQEREDGNNPLNIEQRWKLPDFKSVVGSEIVGSSAPGSVVALTDIWSWINGDDPEPLIVDEPALREQWLHFVAAFREALSARVTIQTVPNSVLASDEEYLRYFRRVGQGGTALSNDELTYSIIKFRYPEVRQRMQEMMKHLGRLASEVDIVLAALRVARVQHGDDRGALGRPTPDAVGRLEHEGQQSAQISFMGLLGLSADGGLPTNAPRLQKLLLHVRKALEFDGVSNPSGLPSLLLARMPRELVDVLLLFGAQRGDDIPWSGVDRDHLIAFAIHWLLFVSNNDAAAFIAYEHASKSDWQFSRARLQALIARWEVEGRARSLLRLGQLDTLRQVIDLQSERLRSWDERFVLLDGGRDVGVGLRVLSTHAESIRRVMLWLQRKEIQEMGYDPTSDRDEDLPIDLDHIIPHARFNFDWRHRALRLCESLAVSDDFRYRRSDLGNSLGNFRWMGSSENRRRQEGVFVPLDGDRSGDADWNLLVDGERVWSEKDAAMFQYFIDRRSIDLYQTLLEESGIANLCFADDAAPASA